MHVIFFCYFEYIITKMKVTYKKYPEIYKVENETFQDIAKKLGIDVFVLQKNNEISNLSKGDYIEIINQNFYVVKPLDTISSISRKLDVSEQMLIQKNNIRQIFIGQIMYY